MTLGVHPELLRPPSLGTCSDSDNDYDDDVPGDGTGTSFPKGAKGRLSAGHTTPHQSFNFVVNVKDINFA